MDYQTLTYTTLPRTGNQTGGARKPVGVWDYTIKGEQESIMQTTNLLTFFFWAIDWFATNVSIIKSI